MPIRPSSKYPFRTIALWLWRNHRGCRTQALVNMAAGIAQVGLALWGIELLRQLADIATHAREGSLMLTGALLAGIFIAEMLLNILVTWLRAVLGAQAQNTLQKQFFEHLLNGKWQGIERFHSGDVLNRLFGDVNDIVSLLTEVLPSAVVVAVQFAASFAYLYAMDAELALLLVVITPLFVLFSRIYFRRMRRIVRKIKDSNSALQAIIQESVQHKMVVKVMERGPWMSQRLARRQQVFRQQVRSRARFSIFSKSLINIGFAGGYLTALLWGLTQLQQGLITVGVLMAFTQLINRIQRPVLDMARLLPTMVGSLAGAERLMELEELPPEPLLPPTPMAGSTGVRLNDVSYQYTSQGRHILRHFSHDFRPGTFTAVMGETGAGKTTLIRLMLALIQPTEGSITLYTADGQHAVDTSTRTNFSYVPQGNTLFSGTIRQNLQFGSPNATTQEMEHALHLAQADFVLSLPDGLDTRCGEGGGGLSEGQAQRIAIARALLRPSRILLLDEATSAIDLQTEEALLQQLRQHLSDTTVIFVTHRTAVTHIASDVLTLDRNPQD